MAVVTGGKSPEYAYFAEYSGEKIGDYLTLS
jgi:hypothetical protein